MNEPSFAKQAVGNSCRAGPAEETPPLRMLVISRNLPPLTGGMERLMKEALDGLSRTELLDVMGPSGYVNSRVRQVINYPFSIAQFSAGVIFELAFLRSGSFDLVVGGSLLMAPLARLAAARVGCPFVLLAHGTDITFPSWVYQKLYLRSALSADRVITNSSYSQGELLRRGFDPLKLRILHPGVHLPPQCRATPNGLRQRLGLSDQPIVLGMGRVLANKGFGDFITQVLPQVHRHAPDVHFVLAGDEPAGRSSGKLMQLRDLARQAGVAGQVHCIGELPMDGEEIGHCFAAASVHVFPASGAQGFGMVALEAAAHGVPTVAYAVGGVIDAVSEGVSGRLVEPGRADEFARAIVGILRNGMDAGRMCEFAAGYSWQRYVHSLRGHLHEVVRAQARRDLHP